VLLCISAVLYENKYRDWLIYSEKSQTYFCDLLVYILVVFFTFTFTFLVFNYSKVFAYLPQAFVNVSHDKTNTAIGREI